MESENVFVLRKQTHKLGEPLKARLSNRPEFIVTDAWLSEGTVGVLVPRIEILLLPASGGLENNSEDHLRLRIDFDSLGEHICRKCSRMVDLLWIDLKID